MATQQAPNGTRLGRGARRPSILPATSAGRWAPVVRRAPGFGLWHGADGWARTLAAAGSGGLRGRSVRPLSEGAPACPRPTPNAQRPALCAGRARLPRALRLSHRGRRRWYRSDVAERGGERVPPASGWLRRSHVPSGLGLPLPVGREAAGHGRAGSARLGSSGRICDRGWGRLKGSLLEAWTFWPGRVVVCAWQLSAGVASA